MLTTFDRSEWKEDPVTEKQCEDLSVHSTPADVRTLFPYTAVTKQKLMAYGIPAGATLRYVRARHQPGFYPLTAVIGVADELTWGARPRQLYLSSAEVQVLET